MSWDPSSATGGIPNPGKIYGGTEYPALFQTAKGLKARACLRKERHARHETRIPRQIHWARHETAVILSVSVNSPQEIQLRWRASSYFFRIALELSCDLIAELRHHAEKYTTTGGIRPRNGRGRSPWKRPQKEKDFAKTKVSPDTRYE